MDLVEKMTFMHDQMGKFSKEKKTIRKCLMNMLDFFKTYGMRDE